MLIFVKIDHCMALGNIPSSIYLFIHLFCIYLYSVCILYLIGSLQSAFYPGTDR